MSEALLHWRATFKDDGATRFGEVAGSLNQMTIRPFGQRLRATREFFTAMVRCRLRPKAVSRTAMATGTPPCAA